MCTVRSLETILKRRRFTVVDGNAGEDCSIKSFSDSRRSVGQVQDPKSPTVAGESTRQVPLHVQRGLQHLHMWKELYMDSRGRMAAQEANIDNDGLSPLIQNTSTDEEGSSGDLPDREQAVDYSSMDCFHQRTAPTSSACRDGRQRGARSTQPVPSTGTRTGGRSNHGASTVARTFTNPDGMASRSVTHPRSCRLRQEQHSQVLHNNSNANFSQPAAVHVVLQENNSCRNNGTPEQGRKKKQRRPTSTWTDDAMKGALAAVNNGVSMRAASKEFSIPYSTLREWSYRVRNCRKRGPPPTLNPVEEQQIVDYLVAMSELGYGLSPTAFKLKVYEITRGRWTPFVNGIPGRGWMRCWQTRHPDLTVRVAQALEVARAQGLTGETATSFYDNLEVLYRTHSYSADRIWNCDETGTQAGRNGGAHVIARKGARNVHSVVPDKREWMSILVCINAAGTYIPSFYIFRGKRFRQNYIQKCEAGATMAMQQKAWMTCFLFSRWLSHFVKNVQKLGGISLERRHLLILDGHSSHVSLEVIQIARAVGLDLLTLPSHTSHALQPLDCSVFKPFKQHFRAYRDYWSRANVAATPSKQTLAQWVSLALRKALSTKNIKSGFQTTGILPLDREVTQQHMKPVEVFRPTCSNGNGTMVCHEQASESLDATTVSEVEDRPAPSIADCDLVSQGDDTITPTAMQDDIEDQILGSEEIATHFAEEHEPGVEHFFVAFSPNDPDVPDEMVTFDADSEAAGSIAGFLTLPSLTPRVTTKHRDPVVDYTKSIMLTSDEYMTAMEELQQAKIHAAEEKQRLREEKEERKKRKAADREEERLEREVRATEVAQARAAKAQEQQEARAKRQEAAAERAAQKAQKAAERAQSQRLKVMQAAERASRPQERNVDVQENHSDGLATVNVNMPFPPFASSSTQLHDNDPFVTTMYSTLPSIPHAALPYMIPGSHFAGGLYSQPLRPEAWSAASTPSIFQGAVSNSAQRGASSTGRGGESHNGQMNVPRRSFPGWQPDRPSW